MSPGYFLPCLFAFAASVGFSLLLNVHGRGILICGLGGALGWFSYLLVQLPGANVFVCSFFAAVVVSGYAEIMARVNKDPVTGYLLLSFFPLVPGAGIYRTMEYSIAGDTARFLITGLETAGIAGCLAIGVLMVSTVVRIPSILRAGRASGDAK
ncbi:hypothetical protein SDC9_72110 [bioreactor metagenome]|uniref:Threonine/Serine exporter ThrE domain-containing protein n=1 Tax=bioreactor metagenome TaxID=1076179 RepID=A0A644YGJ6_9ZZZZ